MRKRVFSLVLVFALLMVLAPFTHAGVYGDNLSDYNNLESKYFIYDSDLFMGPIIRSGVSYTGFDLISPENFNKFMSRMDLQYEALVDLTGRDLNGGNKVRIRDGENRSAGAMFVERGRSGAMYSNSHYAQLNRPHVTDAGEWYFVGASHELGHLFCWPGTASSAAANVLSWANFDIEGWADMLAFIASHVNITVKGYGGIYHQGANQTPANWAAMSSVTSTGQARLFVNSLFTPDKNPSTIVWTDESFDFGYKLLQKVFRSYHNGYIPRYTYSGSTAERRYQLDFVDRCLYFAVEDPYGEAEPEDLYRSTGVMGYNELLSGIPSLGLDAIIRTENPGWTPPSPDTSTPSPTPSPGTSTPTPTPTPSPATTDDCCIDYSNPSADIIVNSSGTPKINLSTETLDLGGFVPAEFDIGNGKGYKAVKADTFGDKKFPKLLNKGLTLKLKNSGGTEVTFPAINPRPKPKFSVNYELAASGGEFGQWVLAEKNSSTAVKTNIQIGIAGPNAKGVENKGKTVDTNGWGKFYTDGGICVKPIGEKNGKPAVVKTTYFYRAAPSDEGGFTPGSAQKKIKVTSQLKPTKYKPGANKAKADKTYVNGVLYAKKAEFTLAAGDQVWHGATAKKAASAKQTVG
ncbi:MAG: hypothetical protein FWH04_00955 [Oscillospiraceae bacterium]|nr:hypothetical protein [Oscillospiraceae bacterium]